MSTVIFDIIGETEETRIVAGDSKELRIVIPDVPDTQSVVGIKFTVKEKELDTDYLFQKDITDQNQNGIGEITDDGSGLDHTARARVDLTVDDTPLLLVADPFYGLRHKFFDIQATTGTGKVETVTKGRISALRQITTN